MYLTIQQVAERLNISPATISSWVSEGRIPAYRFGERRGIRIHEADLQKFIEASRIMPGEVIEEDEEETSTDTATATVQAEEVEDDLDDFEDLEGFDPEIDDEDE